MKPTQGAGQRERTDDKVKIEASPAENARE